MTTVLPGANPQVVESAVTDILEEELSTVEGLRTLTSSSAEGVSNITLEFNLERGVEAAAQDTRDKVARIRERLPEDVEEPVVAKQDADAQPFFWLALSGENYDLLQLSDIGDRLVKSRLQTLPGVGQARIFGERRFSMRVWLSRLGAVRPRAHGAGRPAGHPEPQRRGARGPDRIRAPGVHRPLAGRAQDPGRVRQSGGQQHRRHAGQAQGSGPGRAGRGGRAERAALQGHVRRWRSAWSASRSPTSSRWPEAIRAELPRIQAVAAARASTSTSPSTSRSSSSAPSRRPRRRCCIAALLVVVIIFIFLRNLRATIIPGLAIPTSIVAAFAIMYFLGFSINNFTLLALTLAIGIVVDDAIIVLENAYRHQEELDETPEEAAINGTREIAFAVLATTIALVAVFTPLAFLKGSTGRLFNEFGIAVAGSVIISGLRGPDAHADAVRQDPPGAPAARTAVPGAGERVQPAGLGVCPDPRPRRSATGWWWWSSRSLVTAGAVLVFRSLKREFVPPEDRGWFFTFIIAPEGSSLAYTDGYQRQAEAILAKTKGVDSYFSVVNIGDGVSRGIIFTNLDDWSKRDRSVQEIVNEVQAQFFGIPGVFAFANNPPAFGWGSPVNFVIQHSDFDSLAKGNDTLLARARQVPGLVNVDSDLRVNKPQLTVSFDRDRAEDLGVPVSDVATTLQVLLGGNKTGTFTRANKQYDVIVQLDPRARATPSDMTGLYVRGRDGKLVKLEALASVQGGRRTPGAQPLQPGALRHPHGQPGARLHPGRGARLAEPDRQRGAAPRQQHRAGRRVPRAGGERLGALLRLPAGPGGGVHGAGQPVRVAGAPVHGAAGGAARGDRRAFHAQAGGLDHQRVQPDRHDPADRPGDQELHSAGGVHQPAEGTGHGHARRGAGGRPDPAAARS